MSASTRVDRIRQRHLRDDRVPFGGFDRQSRCEQVVFDGDAIGAGSRQHQCQLQGVGARAVENDETVDIREALAGNAHR